MSSQKAENGKRDTVVNRALSAEESHKRAVLSRNLADDPDLLLRLSRQDMKLVLSQPVLERQEANNIALQFKSPRCVVDVYYALPSSEDVSQAEYAPSYVDMRDDAGQAQQDTSRKRECVRSLL